MNDQAKNEDEVTPDGAVEVSEQDLDQAAGGAVSMEQPSDVSTANGTTADKAGQKSVPQDPSIGLLSDWQKKL